MILRFKKDTHCNPQLLLQSHHEVKGMLQCSHCSVLPALLVVLRQMVPVICCCFASKANDEDPPLGLEHDVEVEKSYQLHLTAVAGLS